MVTKHWVKIHFTSLSQVYRHVSERVWSWNMRGRHYESEVTEASRGRGLPSRQGCPDAMAFHQWRQRAHLCRWTWSAIRWLILCFTLVIVTNRWNYNDGSQRPRRRYWECFIMYLIHGHISTWLTKASLVIATCHLYCPYTPHGGAHK